MMATAETVSIKVVSENNQPVTIEGEIHNDNLLVRVPAVSDVDIWPMECRKRYDIILKF